MKTTIYLISLVFILASCSGKEEDNDPINNEPTQQENSYPADESTAYQNMHQGSDKTWVARDFNLSTVGTQDCRLDDQITFFSDMTYSYNNGSTKCGGDVSDKEGKYEIDYEDKLLIFDGGTSDERVADIVSLSDNRIVVTGGWSIYQIKATFESQ